METSNYLDEAYLTFDDETCRIYIQPNFAVFLQKEDIIDLTDEEIIYSNWFYKTNEDKEACFKKIENKRLKIIERIININVLIIKVKIL